MKPIHAFVFEVTRIAFPGEDHSRIGRPPQTRHAIDAHKRRRAARLLHFLRSRGLTGREAVRRGRSIARTRFIAGNELNPTQRNLIRRVFRRRIESLLS